MSSNKLERRMAEAHEERAEQHHVETMAAILAAGIIAQAPELTDSELAFYDALDSGLRLAHEIARKNRKPKP